MKKKNLLATLMATAMCVASLMPAMAAEQQFNGPVDGTAGAATVPVTCEIESGYTVKLPAAISLAKNTVADASAKDNYAAGYVVSVSGNIASDQFVNVTPTNTAAFKLTAGSRSVTPAVYANAVSWDAASLGDGTTAVDKGSMIEATIPYAGSYSGTLDYSFGLDNKAATNNYVNASASHTVVDDAGVLSNSAGN